MNQTKHSAVGPALGYYYQAIYALITLFDSKNDDAFVSIETFDDVYHSDGDIRNLQQLKHTINPDTIISIKSDELWNTLKVWCDYLHSNNAGDGIFTLSTVAKLKNGSLLELLMDNNSNRETLVDELINEAQRVIDTRNAVEMKNAKRLENKEEPNNLPYNSKFKGCESFLNLTTEARKSLVDNIHLKTSSFTIANANKEVIKRIKSTTKKEDQTRLAEHIIAWWDREAVKSLTGEREECIYLTELQEFISYKNSELYTDGFTDDLDDIDIPEVINPNLIQVKQLDIIAASRSQRRRSYDTEIRARIQRDIWMNNSLPAICKLEKFDTNLIRQWKYLFEEINDNSQSISEENKKEKGRELLDWSHYTAPTSIKSISPTYSNPELISGSYQMLSSKKKVGWHCDYEALIKMPEVDNE